jgi:hypothetical protein
MRNDGGQGKIDAVDFVLCEDDKTIMIYAYLDNDDDATIAIWFDLLPGEAFDPNRYHREFSKRLTVV